jgi:hypothetical protein
MTIMSLLWLLSCGAVALAQQVYIHADGPSSRPQCTANHAYAAPNASPTYHFNGFSFTQTETVRTATSVEPARMTTYAPPYASLSHLLPHVKTTTWGHWNPNATVKATDIADPYGQAAWTAQWERVSLADFTFKGLHSTTVSPTPVPTSELVLPPVEYFTPQDCYSFPKDFILGVAGSAVQIEGAIAEEGRAPTLMEILIVPDSENSPEYVTNENYYLYKQDIERLAAMGVKYYSFSISWTRILPFALEGTPVNRQGLDHYDDLINFVLSKGMQPTVTLIHYDTPVQFYGKNLSSFADRATVGYLNGGYQNETFEDSFVYYGKILMTHFADRVPIWFTFNEPLLNSLNGKSVDTVIKSHARLYHFYHEEIGGTGKISLKLNDNFGLPKDPKNPAEVHAANHFNEYQLATSGIPSSWAKTTRKHTRWPSPTMYHSRRRTSSTLEARQVRIQCPSVSGFDNEPLLTHRNRFPRD